jgi:hypothetical protein
MLRTPLLREETCDHNISEAGVTRQSPDCAVTVAPLLYDEVSSL